MIVDTRLAAMQMTSSFITFEILNQKLTGIPHKGLIRTRPHQIYYRSFIVTLSELVNNLAQRENYIVGEIGSSQGYLELLDP